MTGPVGEWREVERRLRAAGHRPFSMWQLLGAGAVGSQSLLGNARLHEVRRRLIAAGRTVTVWPFETGLRPPHAGFDLVVAEMWPTLLVGDTPLPPHWIRDAAQVDRAVRWALAADVDGRLDAAFAPVVDDPEAVVAEEGWVLGVT